MVRPASVLVEVVSFLFPALAVSCGHVMMTTTAPALVNEIPSAVTMPLWWQLCLVSVRAESDHPRAAVAVGDVVGADGLLHANDVLGFFAKERHVRT